MRAEYQAQTHPHQAHEVQCPLVHPYIAAVQNTPKPCSKRKACVLRVPGPLINWVSAYRLLSSACHVENALGFLRV